VESREHIAWFSSVGSSRGTLTAYVTKDSTIEVTRGCFQGTLAEFEAAVLDRHSDNQYAKEYQVLVQFVQLRFESVIEKKLVASLVE
jgi:hypothetical protein